MYKDWLMNSSPIRIVNGRPFVYNRIAAGTADEGGSRPEF